MGGTRAEPSSDGPETPASAGLGAPEQDSFVERMERAARGVPGASPADDPDLSGEERFDAG